MKRRLSDPSQVESVYDLSAVLIHKGTAVNSGHYIAHIKDENTGQWWEFDDETVLKLGCHPFGEGPSSPTSKSVGTEKVLNPSCAEPNGAVANGDHTNSFQQQSSKSSIGSHVEIFSSCDAYMLMYNLRCSTKDDDKGYLVSGANGSKIEDDVVSLQNGVSLPSHLWEELKDFNETYVDSCQKYSLKKELELNQITERRQEVRAILSEAPVRSLEEPFFWISADWLRQWADNITPP